MNCWKQRGSEMAGERRHVRRKHAGGEIVVADKMRRQPSHKRTRKESQMRINHCFFKRGAAVRSLGMTIVAVLLTTTASSPQLKTNSQIKEQLRFISSLQPGEPIARPKTSDRRQLQVETANPSPDLDEALAVPLAVHHLEQMQNALKDKDGKLFPQWHWRDDSPGSYAFKLVVGGGGGVKLPPSLVLGERTRFTIANCTWIDRGAAMPVPGETVPNGTTYHSASSELCTPCTNETASAELHRAKDGSVVSATYMNCSQGSYAFMFKLESEGIWDLRASVGKNAIESTVVRVEMPSSSTTTNAPEDETATPAKPASPAVVKEGPEFYLRPPGFSGTTEGTQGLVSIESRGWVGGSLGVEGLVGTLCGQDLAVVLHREGFIAGKKATNYFKAHRFNGTVAACRGVGVDQATGKPKIFGGFGLTKGSNISTALSCTHAHDAQGRCEIYFLSYSAPAWGEYAAIFTNNGTPILNGLTFPVNIFPPPGHPWFNTTSLVASRDDWVYGDTLMFSVLPRNAARERIYSCDAPVTAAISDGVAQVRANVTCGANTQGHAVYSISISRVLQDGAWSVSALLDGRHVLHSPLHVNIRPGVSARHSVLTGDGMFGAVAGLPANVYLHMMLHQNVPSTDCSEPVQVVLVQMWETTVEEVEEAGSSAATVAKAGPKDQAAERQAMHMSVTGEVVQCAEGQYHLTYTCTAAGNYTLSILIGRHKDVVFGTPVTLQVYPGALSSQHCGVVGDRIGDGRLLYGTIARFEVYLRDQYGNYLSCEHYYAGIHRHNISELSIYHEAGDNDWALAWSVPATIGACHDVTYLPTITTDGVLDVSFVLPPLTRGATLAKEISLDLEVRVDGKRLKQGPFTMKIRPARLSLRLCTLHGDGISGAQPGEEKVIELQLVNELGENMTTCGSVENLADLTGAKRCSALQDKEACRARTDCDWTVLASDTGACSLKEQSELVELYLRSMQLDGAEKDLGLEKLSGTVKACDRGLYQLSYTVKEQGRFLLHVVVGGKEVSRSPFRIYVAPGCRSGAVQFPCQGRGVCGEKGQCACLPGYLGEDCERECPGLDHDGMFCSGRGNCTAQETCECAYGFIGRLCQLECPGGAGNVCNGNGLCLENGECRCLEGYGGEKCQFKNREVENFGSMSAMVILVTLLVLNVILVFVVVMKSRTSKRGRKGVALSYSTLSTTDDVDEDPNDWDGNVPVEFVHDVAAKAAEQRDISPRPRARHSEGARTSPLSLPSPIQRLSSNIFLPTSAHRLPNTPESDHTPRLNTPVDRRSTNVCQTSTQCFPNTPESGHTPPRTTPVDPRRGLRNDTSATHTPVSVSSCHSHKLN